MVIIFLSIYIISSNFINLNQQLFDTTTLISLLFTRHATFSCVFKCVLPVHICIMILPCLLPWNKMISSYFLSIRNCITIKRLYRQELYNATKQNISWYNNINQSGVVAVIILTTTYSIVNLNTAGVVSNCFILYINCLFLLPKIINLLHVWPKS